jgi:hypothetical protein
MHQFGISASGLMSQRLRDLDAGAARAPLPARALPDDVRRRLKLPNRAVDDHAKASRLPPVQSNNKAKMDRFSLPPDILQAHPRKRISDQQKKTSPYIMVTNSFLTNEECACLTSGIYLHSRR